MTEPEQQQGQQQQTSVAQITIPVTIQTVDATQNQQIAIPIGLQAAGGTDNVSLQQIQQHVQQQVQLQQQQQIQVTQLQQVDQVQQIQQQVQQINQEAQQLEINPETQQLDQEPQQQALPAESSPAASNGGGGDATTIEISLQEDTNGNATLDNSTASLNDSTASLNDSTASDCGPTPSKKSKWSKYVKRYNKKWESEPGLKEWIRRVPGDDTKVACRYCQNTIRAHHTELKRHSLSAKHKSQAAYVVRFYRP